MTKKLKKRIQKICIGVIPYIAALVLEKMANFDVSINLLLILYLIAYLVIGGDVVKTAVSNISHGQIFDENFLMLIATVGAFFVGEFPEAVAVMLFYQVGECFQSYAVNKSRKSISDLMDIRPDYAVVIRNGEESEVEPDEVAIGETIIVKPGEKVPLDGTLIEGASSLDTMALTGESLPRDVKAGEEIISGCINITGVIKIQVTKAFGESTVSKILELVENATDKKSKSENFISKFAKYYTPAVVGCAAVLAILPPLILGGGWSTWIYRALSFLVISCPCALVISVPLSFFGGIGGAGKAGILVKGSNYLETISKVDTIVMDKTGTLTKGNFAVSKMVPSEESIAAGIPEGRLLELAAYGENFSNHPISFSLKKEYAKEIDDTRLADATEVPGHGTKLKLDGKELLVGNQKLMEVAGISCREATEIGTVVYVSYDGKYMGYIVISDEIKTDAPEAIKKLKASGIKNIIMLTGDRKETAQAVADKLGISKYYAELFPADKVTLLEKILEENQSKVAFVGDGVNDAPSLARADVGIAMGGLGSDAAIEAADIVIMNDEPSKIAGIMKISRKTLSIVKQNIIFAIGVKILVLILAACGKTTMWAAVFADVGVAFIAILNAMRAMRTK